MGADGVEPAWTWTPGFHATLGPEVGDLATAAGLAPDPEQRLLLDQWFARRVDGKPAALEVGVACPRQNLKTGALKMAALGWLYILELELSVWSAHLFDTSQEAFRDMCVLIESTPDLDREVKQIHRGNGDEAIELLPGRSGSRRLKFKARSKGGGRGLTGNRVVFDEAMFVRPEHMGALMPTMAAVDDAQLLFAGSAGFVDSTHWRSIRDRGRKGGDPSLAYSEWGDHSPGGCTAEDCDHRYGIDGCALDDRRRWVASNPAMGRRITEEFIEGERRALPPDEFARERLGWWEDPAETGTDLSPQAWAELANPDAEASGRLVLGADVAPSHAWSSIYLFGGGPIPVGGLVERHSGSSWLVDRLAALTADRKIKTVGVDPSGPIGALIPALEAAGVPVTVLESRDAVRACGAFVAATNDRLFRHRGDPELTAAVAGAARRNVGDGGWKWSRRDSTVDITGLVAATVAYWLASVAEPDYDPLANIF